MKQDEIHFVQFLHPGGECRPGPDGKVEWNRPPKPHRRKFLQQRGRYVTGPDDPSPQDDDLHFWAEWEPQSELIGPLPRGAPGDSQVPFPPAVCSPGQLPGVAQYRSVRFRRHFLLLRVPAARTNEASGQRFRHSVWFVSRGYFCLGHGVRGWRLATAPPWQLQNAGRAGGVPRRWPRSALRRWQVVYPECQRRAAASVSRGDAPQSLSWHVQLLPVSARKRVSRGFRSAEHLGRNSRISLDSLRVVPDFVIRRARPI